MAPNTEREGGSPAKRAFLRELAERHILENPIFSSDICNIKELENFGLQAT